MKKLFFILLALCVVFFLASCDDGGSSGGGGDSSAFDAEYTAISGGSNKYVVNDIVGRTDPPISDFSNVDGGIKFKEDTGMGNMSVEIHITIFLNNDTRFASKEGGKIDGESIGNFEYTGTWSRSGTTITMTATKEKDLDTGKVKDCNKVMETEISNDESTLTDKNIHGDAGSKFIYKK